MEGRIEIEVVPNQGMAVEMNLRRVSFMDKLALVQAVVDALGMDKKEQHLLSMMFSIGGLG